MSSAPPLADLRDRVASPFILFIYLFIDIFLNNI